MSGVPAFDPTVRCWLCGQGPFRVRQGGFKGGNRQLEPYVVGFSKVGPVVRSCAWDECGECTTMLLGEPDEDAKAAKASMIRRTKARSEANERVPWTTSDALGLMMFHQADAEAQSGESVSPS